MMRSNRLSAAAQRTVQPCAPTCSRTDVRRCPCADWMCDVSALRHVINLFAIHSLFLLYVFSLLFRFVLDSRCWWQSSIITRRTHNTTPICWTDDIQPRFTREKCEVWHPFGDSQRSGWTTVLCHGRWQCAATNQRCPDKRRRRLSMSSGFLWIGHEK